MFPILYMCIFFQSRVYIHPIEHDIKHFGTFGSPKIAKHVHFGPMGPWERVRERHWCMGTYVGTWMGTCLGTWERV